MLWAYPHTILSDAYVTFVVAPSVIMLFLNFYPKRFKSRVLYIVVWTTLCALIEGFACIMGSIYIRQRMEPFAFLWISARHVCDDSPALYPAAADLAGIRRSGLADVWWVRRAACPVACAVREPRYVIMQLLPSLSLQNLFIRAMFSDRS